MILTEEKDCDAAISFVKKHCTDTSIVSLKTVQEIKDLYEYTNTQKVLLLLTLMISFLIGSLSYFGDVGADYILLHKSHNCPSTSQFTNHSNTTSKCVNETKFCEFTVGSFQYYFAYTLIACLVPFVLNIMLVAIDSYRRGRNSLIWLPIRIFEHHDYHKKHQCLYSMLSVINWIIWAPFLIALYPIATKLAYVPISYMVQVTTRSLAREKGSKIETAKTKTFYDDISQSLTSEVVKSSTLEVLTESTLQPLLQLYAMTSTCGFNTQFTFSNLFSSAVFSNTLLFSVVTSLLSFSMSMTTYHVYSKQGALGIQSNLEGRVLLLAYFLVYTISRMFILIIAAHQVFGGFGYFLVFVLAHVILMLIIHLVHLYNMKIKRNYRSLDFWIENLMNCVGSILIPNSIKYPRTDENETNHRYHEPTSFRYLSMHIIFFLENVVLVTLSTLNLTPSSPLFAIFEDPKDNNFIKMFPYWTLGLFLLALVFKFLYYQSHAWPINPNCFTIQFLWPFDQDKLEGKIIFSERCQ